MERRSRTKRNAGFTFMETLIAVAILVILLAVSAVSVVYYARYLKITELDNAAREIYMAAENRAVLLTGRSRLNGLVSGTDNGLVVPLSADGGAGNTDAYYITNTDGVLSELLPAESIDPALRDPGRCFYIVYEPVSGSVTDVFYAEKDVAPLGIADFQAFYNKWTTAGKTERMNAKPMLGYYGGGMAESVDVKDPPRAELLVTINNGEKLTVTVTYKLPDGVTPGDEELKVCLGGAAVGPDALKDGNLPTGTIPLDLSQGEPGLALGGGTTYTWTLDSLDGGPQFKSLSSLGSSVKPGENFTVSAALFSKSGQFKTASDSDTDNSLFAKGSGGTTAVIKCLRHLQNLDNIFSGVEGKTAAIQTENILCRENETYPNYEFWPIQNDDLVSYTSRPNPQSGAEGEPEYCAIRGLYVTQASSESGGGKFGAGLFAQVGGSTGVHGEFNNIYLIDAEITLPADSLIGSAGSLAGSVKEARFTNCRSINATVNAPGANNAGGLVGEAESSIFNGCQVYWEAKPGEDLRSVLGSDAEGDQYEYKVVGHYAGGLVGRFEGVQEGNNGDPEAIRSEIINCLAATTVRGEGKEVYMWQTNSWGTEPGSASGLIGILVHTLEITDSYADCYLSGGSAAGLVYGDSYASYNLTLNNCYAAGFIDTETGVKTAAGLCLGAAAGSKTVTNHVYTVVRPLKTFTGDDKTYYQLTEKQSSDSFTNTYFLGGGEAGINGATGMGCADMITDGFCGTMGAAFERKTAEDSHPYNLRDSLTLTTYSFPGLTGLPHYGDWAAEFIEPSLVYYEQYSAGAPGFSGGNTRHLIGALSDVSGSVVSDGYAVAFLEKDLGAAEKVTVAFTYFDGARTEQTLSRTYALPNKAGEGEQELIPTTWDNENGEPGRYYLAPLPAELVNSGTASENFFQYLKFVLDIGTKSSSGEYFYNPHFPETVIPHVRRAGDTAPWTAQQVLQYAGTLLQNRRNVKIRTARHLYSLSRFSEYYHNRLNYLQQLPINYNTYTGYGLFSPAEPAEQYPIGRWGEAFLGIYDGGCKTIEGVKFSVPKDSDRYYAGLFGYSEGTLRNIVYQMPDEEVSVAMGDGSRNLFVGGLVGGNGGTGRVWNCAVSGVRLTGYAFGAGIYVGGLAGQNAGVIENSAAEAAALSADCSNYARAYVGAMVGENSSSGIISCSYAVGRVTAEVDTHSEARVCGFVGFNSGRIGSSYAAADLQSSGANVMAYGFCGMRQGTQENTFYLNVGNFTYRGVSYGANYEQGTAVPATYEQLTTNPAYLPNGMKIVTDGGFPYPRTVRNEKGEAVHYGEYPEPMEMGEMGVYYWEKLAHDYNDTNGSYYISLLAVDPGERKVTKQSTLSTAHDDGYVVTEYGYGYYSKAEIQDNVTFSASKIAYTGFVRWDNRKQNLVLPYMTATNSPTNGAADAALGQLMPGYTFHSWNSYHEGGRSTSNDITNETYRAAHATAGLCPVYGNNTAPPGGEHVKPNDGAFTLEQRSGTNTFTIEFTVNPQFADAMSVNTIGMELKNGATTVKPGTTEGTAFQVRCGTQLQEINWFETAYTDVPVGHTDGDYNYHADRFPYLSAGDADPQYYWKQTHDMDWTAEGNIYYAPNDTEQENPLPGIFYAIAEVCITNETIPGWFGGTYDGGSYTMKNFNIGVNATNYDVNSMGLFGVVQEATLKDIVMYSEQGTDTVTVKGRKAGGSDSWYAGGTLVGLALNSTISNCAVAGYTIVDETDLAASSGVGGAIGGLVGMTDRPLTGCTAATKIQINCKHTGRTPIRVGGLVGSTTSMVERCYTGGTIEIGPSVRTRQLYIGGIIGGVGMEQFSGKTVNAKVSNCYTYIELPEASNTRIREIRAIGGSGGNGNTVALDKVYFLNSAAKLVDNTAESVTYRQLQGKAPITPGGSDDEIYTLLSGFNPVTSEIDGFSVAGKYSYVPKNKPELQGMDYPFPTVLNQGVNNRHVHYGEWPNNGIERQEGGAPIGLDIFAEPLREEDLTLVDTSASGTWNAACADPTVANAVCENGHLRVTAVGKGTTKLTVSYGDYELELTVNVTAELRLDPEKVTMFTNDTVVVPLSACDRNMNLVEYPQDAEADGLAVLPENITCDSELLTVEKAEEEPPSEENPGKPPVRLRLASGGESGEDIRVNVGFTCTYQTVPYEDARPISVTVIELPEAVFDQTERSYTVDFTGHSVSALSAALVIDSEEAPETPPAVVKPEGSDELGWRIVVTDVAEGVTEIPLNISLTMDGWSHTIQMTIPVNTGEAQEP